MRDNDPAGEKSAMYQRTQDPMSDNSRSCRGNERQGQMPWLHAQDAIEEVDVSPPLDPLDDLPTSIESIP